MAAVVAVVTLWKVSREEMDGVVGKDLGGE